MSDSGQDPDLRDAGPGPASAPDPAAEHGMRGRAAETVAWGQELYRRLEGRRPTSQVVEVGFRWLERDVQIAGGVLGGGLAYRFFFWILALSVLASGVLGFASRAGADLQSTADDAGVAETVAESVVSAAQQSENGRWWLLFLGIWLTLWFSWGLLRALRLVHAAAWGIELRPIQRPLLGLAAVIAAPFVLATLIGGSGWVRVNVGVLPGALATLGVGAIFAVIWLRVSMRLPSPELPWRAFIPGAVLFGLGIEILHVFTVYFLEAKLSSAESHYGALGLAATVLFYLWMIGRGVVWAAELNAVVWGVRHPDDGEGEAAASAPPR
ncbi:MAG: YhjD/YihY/BrkB family envelope integrity protein [Gaiellales bacterium]